MDTVARLPASERAELFRETAARKGIAAPGIIEKDFWVCWTLKHLFTLPVGMPAMLFKGGTSLSKAFGVIERFSEDIDLSLNRHDMGFEGERDPQNAPSNKATERLLRELQEECVRYLRETLVPTLKVAYSGIIGEPDNWTLEADAEDDQTINFTFPSSLATREYSTFSYISPIVRLEFGARSDHWPAGAHEITPYAAEEFPAVFTESSCQVTTLEAERTFWEKATILHAEYHRPEVRPSAERLSRHYYDLAMLARSPVNDSALQQPELLEAVAQHKECFFRAAWAKYPEARPGTLHLCPHSKLEKVLRTDYAKMEEMIFHDTPSFEAIVDELTRLEQSINKLI